MQNSVFLAQRHDHDLAHYHINQGSTEDCGPHVVTMVVNFWHGREVLTAPTTARAMNRLKWQAGWPPLVVRRIPNWATFPWGMVDMLREHDVPARWRLFASADHIFQALSENRIVMPIFGQPFRRRGWKFIGWSHVAILCGWDAEASVFQFVDSAKSHAPSTRPHDEFLRLWRYMGRILIETRD
jgi:hypothetical protein